MAGKTHRIAIAAMSLFSLILLVTTTAHTVTTAEVPNANSVVQDDIEYYIQTDKAVYDVGENVEMLYRVTNVGEEYVDFIFTYGPIDNTCDWMVDKEGLRIWDNLGRGIYFVFTSFNLGPSQSYEYTHTWDMTDNDGDYVSLGNYTVTGALGYYPGHERIVPVSVPIEIIRTYYVNPGESIQARIDDPNVMDGDIIIVNPGTYIENINFMGKNITLRSTNPNDPNLAAATIIDGNNNGSVVTFNHGEDANCVLNGFTITNGTAEHGGGIYCSGPAAPPPPPPPLYPTGLAGVQSIPGVLSKPNFPTPTIRNCIISNNSADAGGGMCNDWASSPTLTNCTFSGNWAYPGGGMENRNESNPTLTNCTFIGNSALYEGGGINNSKSTPTLTNCMFSENSADNGGGMYNNWSSTATLINCTFNGNSAYYEGGGVCNFGDSNTILTNCTFAGNSSVRAGGGMYNNNSNLTLTNCTFNKNSADNGGGMCNDQSSPTLANCNFTDNSATGIGVIYPETPDYGGGGMYNYLSSPNLTNCVFNENSADYGNGGGICNVYSNSNLTNCAFNGNSADYGGGLYSDQSVLTLTSCTFTDNSVIGIMFPRQYPGYGGGMYNYQSSLNLTNCVFNENLADYGDGGGIYNINSELIITHCKFSENSASWDGGGMYNYQSNPTLSNCTFSENSTEQFGGGIFNAYNSNLTVSNSVFSGNLSYIGGGICNDGSNPVLNNCTFTGNFASGNGGGIYNNNGITTLANCIFWENMEGWGSRDESAQISSDPNLTLIIINYSCIHGWTGTLGGTGNIGDDPCFVAPGHFSSDPNCVYIPFYPGCFYDWTGGDYHLFPDSPCVNAGDPNYIAEPNEKGLDGNPRIIGGRIDMGAYEVPPPAEVRITPRTINLASKGNSITCYIRLAENYDVADVDPNSVLLQGKIEAESVQIDEGKQIVTAKFGYEQLQEILNIGEVELTIRLRLTDGTIFEGIDVISVKGKGKPDKYAQATNPDPPDGATNVDIHADLSWTQAPEATSHDVYFGTASPPPFIGNQTMTTFGPGTMDSKTTYYWRIDEINKWGTTTGQTWSFTTVTIPPPPPTPPP
ncbi:MAG: right-handed parallel beta-helix repeat-containing protein [Planctomycetota bacterium]|jgi:hypothetical protein